MSEDPDFEKKFSEIINSEELKDFSENCFKDGPLTVKELLLMQRSLIDALNNIAEIIEGLNNGENDLVQPGSEEFEKLGLLYRISEDFNDSISENFVIFTIDDDEDFEEDDSENGEN
jgi:hypothetical protein